MKLTRLKEIYGHSFGPFVEPFRVVLPESGMCLIRGINKDTGDSSGCGKSTLALSPGVLFGGSPHSLIDLQSWFTDEPLLLGGVLDTSQGEVIVERCKGLTVTIGNEKFKGRSAEQQLDCLFGMSEKLRALTTYRGQGTDGVFWSMSDTEKKSFLSQILDLDQYERIANDAAESAKFLREKLISLETKLELAKTALDNALNIPVTVTGGSAAELKTEADRLEALVEKLKLDISDSEMKIDTITLNLQKEAQKQIEGLKAQELGVLTSIQQEISKVLAVQEPNSLIEARKTERAIQADVFNKQVELEKKKNALTLEFVSLTETLHNIPRLEKELENFKHQYIHLKGQVCPTCRQSWVQSQDELSVVTQNIINGEAHLLELSKVKSHATQVKLELDSIPDVDSNPEVQALKGKLAETTAFIADIKTRFEGVKSGKLYDLRLQEGNARKQMDGKEKEVKSEFQLKLDTETFLLKQDIHAQKYMVDGYRDSVKVCRAEASRIAIEDALQAEKEKRVNESKLALEAAQAEYLKFKTRCDLELDIYKLVGREGFLGGIFDDVLEEIAAATNNILGQVANVRHITFQFDSEKETNSGTLQKRIVPIINVNGRKVNFKSGISGGQQSSVRLAVDLGVGEVAAKRRGSYPGWLVIDEGFDGLGDISKESCMDTLAAYAGNRLILIIDHSSTLQGTFSQIIDIESLDERSRIV